MLGDAAAQGDMPKSGFAANSQAKVCAMAVRGALTGSRVFPPKFSNTCWSLIDTDDGVKVGATYEATDEKIAKVDGFISQTGEDAATRKATYEESEGWYAGITVGHVRLNIVPARAIRPAARCTVHPSKRN